MLQVRVTSPSRMFKFIEVLSSEVWLGVFATILITALLMYFVERVSPLSGAKAVGPGGAPTDPKPRVFSLKESFYFAVSSITPEGKDFIIRQFSNYK